VVLGRFSRKKTESIVKERAVFTFAYTDLYQASPFVLVSSLVVCASSFFFMNLSTMFDWIHGVVDKAKPIYYKETTTATKTKQSIVPIKVMSDCTKE
jgi:hypothetical protein